MRTNWIEANGASFRYELGGHGDVTVVLIHEAGGTLESWDHTCPALQRQFRTLRYDQRGFGLSEKIRGTLSLELVVGDLVALLDALGIVAPCHVVGSALGAGIAIAFAARYPARVTRLVACNPATGISAQGRSYVEDRAAVVERSGMRAVMEQSLNNSYPEILRRDRARYEAYRLRWLGNAPSSFAALNRMAASMDLTADFSRIMCPTLVIAGVHDKLRSPAMIQLVAQAIPGARYVEVDSGHFMAVQTPELFLEHVLPFLHGG